MPHEPLDPREKRTRERARSRVRYPALLAVVRAHRVPGTAADAAGVA